MAAKEMWDYVGPGELDTASTLSTPTPQQVVTEYGTRNQTLYAGDDSASAVTAASTACVFHVTLRWDYLSPSDAGTLMDFYCSPASGDCRAKSFKWTHPTDGHTYVARFDSDLERSIQCPEIHSVPQMRLRIVGGTPVVRLSMAKASQATVSESPSPTGMRLINLTMNSGTQSQTAGKILLFHPFAARQTQMASNIILEIIYR